MLDDQAGVYRGLIKHNPLPQLAVQATHVGSFTGSAPNAQADDVRVALEGDLVYVHFECRDENGEVQCCT